MDSASQTAIGLAGDDSESSVESSKSGDSAETPTNLDTCMGLTAAECDATLAIRPISIIRFDAHSDQPLAHS